MVACDTPSKHLTRPHPVSHGDPGLKKPAATFAAKIDCNTRNSEPDLPDLIDLRTRLAVAACYRMRSRPSRRRSSQGADDMTMTLSYRDQLQGARDTVKAVSIAAPHQLHPPTRWQARSKRWSCSAAPTTGRANRPPTGAPYLRPAGDVHRSSRPGEPAPCRRGPRHPTGLAAALVRARLGHTCPAYPARRIYRPLPILTHGAYVVD